VLHEIAELVFDPRAVPWLVLMCERAMTDPEPQLRAAAMTLTWHLSEHLPNAFLGDASQGSRSLRRLPQRSDPTFAEVYLLQCKLLPVATRLAEDRAPSVRLAVAAQCDRLCNSLGEHWYSVIIDVLQALLGDGDENVRGEAILCVPRLIEIVLVSSTPERAAAIGVLEALLPVSVKLQYDPSPNVRVALATAAGDLLTLLVGLQSIYEISPPAAGELVADIPESVKSNKKHVDNTLIPLLQKLLHDADPEVTSAALRAVTNASRGNVREIRARQNSRSPDDDTLSLSSFQSHTSLEKKDPVFIPVLSEEQVLRLLPTLSDLANSRQWRVRQGAVEIVPALLGCTSKLEIRSEVAQLCFRLMNDRVDAVRKTAAECLCLSGGGLGSHGEESSGEWITAIVIPHVLSCSQSVDSKQRILSLKMVEVILANGICPARKKSSRASLSDDAQPISPQLDLVGIATSLSSDNVANVRLNFGRVACSIISLVEEEELGLLTKSLQDQIETERKRERGGDRDVLFFATRAILRVKERDDVSLTSLRYGSEK
jgi:HEAT repeat protein